MLAKFLRLLPSNRGALIDYLNALQKVHPFLNSKERQSIENILRMKSWKVRDVMTPFSDIDYVKESDDFQTVVDAICVTEHSRYPVVDDNESIVGILLVKDLWKYVDKNNFTVSQAMRKPISEPETKNLAALLEVFLKSKNHMIVVIDEYSKPAGIITIEDLLEKIVGEIEDEFDDEEDKPMATLADGSYRVKGTMSIKEFNSTFNCQIKHDDADNLAELVAAISAKIPKKGESFQLDEITFFVERSDKKRIHNLIVRQNPKP